MSDGSLNTTATMTVSSGDTSKLFAKVNPSNNREVGFLAIAPFADVSSNVLCGGKVATVVYQPVAPVITGIEPGTPGAEIDPPSWLTP